MTYNSPDSLKKFNICKILRWKKLFGKSKNPSVDLLQCRLIRVSISYEYNLGKDFSEGQSFQFQQKNVIIRITQKEESHRRLPTPLITNPNVIGIESFIKKIEILINTLNSSRSPIFMKVRRDVAFNP
jgi:hypothetical protein